MRLFLSQASREGGGANGEMSKSGYLFDDGDLVWRKLPCSSPIMVTSHALVLGTLALPHRTYGDQGVARTTLWVDRKYH